MKSQAERTDQFTITDHWAACLELWIRTRRTENTRRSFQDTINNFKRLTGITDLSCTQKGDVFAWVETMKTEGFKSSTIRNRINTLKLFFNFASDYQVDGKPITETNPVKIRGLVPRVRKYAASRALSKADVARFLGAIQLDRLNGLRDYALLAGYLILGRRNTEWRLARVQDFEMRDGEIIYRWSGKGRTDELIQVPDELWRMLQAYISSSGGRGVFDFVFLDRSGSHPISARRVGQMVKRYARLAGIEGNLRVHDLRHTAVMLRRLAGADVEELRDFLGHANLNTTQIYLHRIEHRQNERGEAVAKMLNLRGKND